MKRQSLAPMGRGNSCGDCPIVHSVSWVVMERSCCRIWTTGKWPRLASTAGEKAASSQPGFMPWVYSSLGTTPSFAQCLHLGRQVWRRHGKARDLQHQSVSQDRNEVLVSVTQVRQVAHLHRWGEVMYRFLGIPQMNQHLQGQGLGV